MKRIVHSLACGVIALIAIACTPGINSDVKRVAAFYVERYLDSALVDTTDTAFVLDLKIMREELDSLTIDWTAVEWEQFWGEVKKARQP